MTKCVSGSHVWLSADDAAKCCHPDWQRILLLGQEAVAKSETPLQVAAGTVYGRRWVHRSELERAS